MLYKILLVDDSSTDREAYTRYLSRESDGLYETIATETIEEGLERYRQESPDLILLDYFLPDGTAIDFIDRGGDEIRCPIIVVNGQGDETIAVEVMKAGARDYLVKGHFTPDGFHQAIQTVLEKEAQKRKIEVEREKRDRIVNLALQIRNSLDLDVILRTTVTETREAIGVDRVLIYRSHPDGSRSLAAVSPREEVTGDDRGDFRSEQYPLGSVEVIADVETAPLSEEYRQFLRRIGVRAKVILPIPIASKGDNEGDSPELWGFLAVHHCSEPRQWEESEIDRLQQLSVQLGIAIGQAELYEEARNANRRLEDAVRIRTEELVRIQEQLNSIIEGSGDGVWYMDILAGTVYLSPRYRQFLGYEDEPEVWLWEKCLERIHPDDREPFERSHQRYLESGAIGIHEFEMRQRAKNGEYKCFYSRGKAIADRTGRIVAMAGSSTDITERKQLERQVQRANKLLNKIYDYSPVGMGLIDAGGRFLRINETLAQINGYSIAEHIGKTLAELLPDLGPRLLPLFQEILDTRQGVSGMEIWGTTPARPDIVRCWTASYYPVNIGDGEWAIGIMVTEITDLKNAERSLTESEAKFRQIAETIEEIFWIASAEIDRLLYISPAFERIVGHSPELLYENPRIWLDSVHPDDREGVESLFRTTLESGGHDREYRIVRPDGEIRWLHDRGFPVRNTAGKIERFTGILSDITERKRLEDSLFQEKELAQITLRSIGDCVITTDELGRVTYLNPVAERLLGLTSREAEGEPLSDIFQLRHETTRERMENPVWRVLQDRQVARVAEGTVLVAKDGREYSVADSAAPILDRSGRLRGTVLVLNDVTDNRAMAQQLRSQAERDALTGLFNRFYFERELDRAIAEVNADSTVEHILCYLDLDRFKVINDTCGHGAGDELLRQLSALLKNQIRSTDTLARIGGDEFALLLYRCPLVRACEVAESIVKTVREFQFVREGQLFRIGVSIGLVTFNSSVESREKLLSEADVACYAAKEGGRNRVHVYRERDERLTRTHRERQWVLEIREAIERERLRLYAQAIVPANPAFVGESFREILLRLDRSDGSIASPMAFLPAMERYGLMPEIDRAVIGLLFRHLEGVIMPANRYMVNLSGATLSDSNFLDFLVGEIRERAIPAGTIGFEITETVAVSNFIAARKFIDRLRECGCPFALDDFGSGMSSFSYLKNLPVDYLKIDGYFVRDILDDPLDGEIVSAIGRIARRLGIRTIAEFVENEAIRARLLDIGIDYVQGYGVAPVLPLESDRNR